MFQRGRLTGWILAMASIAMMVGVRAVHSPLVHMLGGCSGGHCTANTCCNESTAKSTSAATNSTKHSHATSSCGHHHHHHVADTSAAEKKNSDHQDGSHPEHGDRCQLCEFLTKSAPPVAALVALQGEEQVTERPVSEITLVATFTLPGPYVRGPPMTA